MKTILFVVFCFLSLSVYSQTYRYHFRLAEVNDLEAVKSASPDLADIFDVNPTFNQNMLEFIVDSNTDISEETFIKKMTGLGFTVILFSRQPFENWEGDMP